MTGTKNVNAVIIMLANMKGGVLKSTLTASTAAMLAMKGEKVLVIDGDQQGNVTEEDYGIDGDNGRGLASTLQFGNRLEPVRARENLDLIAGGPFLSGFPAAMSVYCASTGTNPSRVMAENLSTALADLVSRNGYTAVLIDSGPGDVVTLDGYLAVADWLIVPTREDRGSIRGVRRLGARLMAAQEAGSDVGLLGVVLTQINPRATRRNEATVEAVAEMFGDPSAVFDSTISLALAEAKDLRDLSVVPADFVTGHAEERGITPSSLWSRDVSKIIREHSDLTAEVLRRLMAAENSASA